MALRAADRHESHRAFQSRDRKGAVSSRVELVTFYGVPMALRAAYRHEGHRAFQSRDRQGAVSRRAELVTF
jgi:hypothetical protein